MHHTKEKGDLGVAKVYADLVENGYIVLFPTTEHSPFDLVAYKDKIFYRIQVKARSMKNGKLSVRTTTSWADKNGSHTKEYDLSELDYFGVYSIDTKECFYIPVCAFLKGKDFTLRINKPKNNQIKNINLAENYKKMHP